MTLIVALVVGIWLVYGLIQIMIGIGQIIWAVLLCAVALGICVVEGIFSLGRWVMGLR